MPLLNLDRKTVRYNGHSILSDISLTIEPGEKIALIGQSGAGKTTLLELLYEQTKENASLVPQELGKLGDGLGGDGNPRTRTVAWPLINMCRLYEATEGMAGQEELHAELYASSKECAEALILVPFERIEGSIHAGVTMEALAKWNKRSNDQATGEYLVGLAR